MPGNIGTKRIVSQKTLHDGQELLDAGLISSQQKEAIDKVNKYYAIAVPPLLASRIQNQNDPIARQVIPSLSELKETPGEVADPIGDERFSPLKGLVHRYEDRVLIKPILICPLYCRFCFRREQVGHKQDSVLDIASWEKIFDYVKDHQEIREVILSGGDPLMLSPRRLSWIFQELDNIRHIKLIRLHTRVPIAMPERVNEALLKVLEDSLKSVWVAIHTNHVKEFSQPACDAFKRLTQVGVALVGQTVLLKNVNDNVSALEALFCKMLDYKIKPYYLHQLDKAPGTDHFHVPVQRGLKLLEALRGRVTGLAWPTYVYDIPGGFGKVPLGPSYLKGDDQVRDPKGQWHKVERI